MKRYLGFIFIFSVISSAFVLVLPANAQQQALPKSEPVTEVRTALNHLSVLEFSEAVTLAAAGSPDFQVERQENKVFIKPLKAGASTDLFVWTASRRFAYELETIPEVNHMNFAIDNAAPTPAPAPAPVSARADEFADMMLVRAFSGAEEISSTSNSSKRNSIALRVEQVFRTRSTIYVHYTLNNNTDRAYRVPQPRAFQLEPGHSAVSVRSFLHKQLDDKLARNMRVTRTVSLPIARSEIANEEIAPNEETEGVIAIRQALDSPAVIELVFGPKVKATFVL